MLPPEKLETQKGDFECERPCLELREFKSAHEMSVRYSSMKVPLSVKRGVIA
jgi:hypothetical protein